MNAYLPLCTSEQPRREDQHIHHGASSHCPANRTTGVCHVSIAKEDELRGWHEKRAIFWLRNNGDSIRSNWLLPIIPKELALSVITSFSFRCVSHTCSLIYRLSQQQAASQQVRSMATEKQSRFNCPLATRADLGLLTCSL